MKYGEIIKHPHYEPKRHPRMPKEMRAAQFAPYGTAWACWSDQENGKNRGISE